MKWKTVLVTAVIVLLVVALGIMASRVLVSQDTRAIKKRIKMYEIVAKEQRLITEIVTLRYDAALIQAKFNPAPVPEINDPSEPPK